MEPYFGGLKTLCDNFYHMVLNKYWKTCYCNHNISIFLYLSLHYMAQKQLFAVSFYSEYLLHLVNTSMLAEVYANWIMPGYVCLNSMTRSWNNKVALDLLQQVLNKIYSNYKFIEFDQFDIFVKNCLYKVIICHNFSIPISFTTKMKKNDH